MSLTQILGKRGRFEIGSRDYLTIRSNGRWDRVSQPVSVTTTVCPKHMAWLLSLSINIMWRKNTMLGAAMTGLP